MVKNSKNYRLIFKVMLLLTVFGVTQNALPQVTIGAGTAPNPSSILDLKENADGSSTRGLLLPRVALQATNLPNPMQEHVAGMLVFNTAAAGDGENQVAPGYYFNMGDRWERLRIGVTNWFYMPSIPLDVTPGQHEVDLHDMYLNMLMSASHSSPGAPVMFKSPLTADQIFYYIVGYDDTVFQIIDITEYGVLTYYVSDESNVSEATFMNIIFVER